MTSDRTGHERPPDGRRPTTRTIYGINPVQEALAAGRRFEHAWALAGSRGPELKALVARLRQARVDVGDESREALARRAGNAKHQGVVAQVAALANGSLKGLVDDHPDEPLTVLVTDHIQDPQNLGAIFRAADAFGVRLVFLPAHDACSHQTGTVAKASAGAVEHVPSVVVAALPSVLAELKSRGFLVLGLEAGSPTDLRAEAGHRRLALVVGGEGSGLTRQVRAACDRMVTIPSGGRVSSLNASMACGIALYERYRALGSQGVAVPEGAP